jgi:glycosyltransferase involved in cell wall biosynthesis
VLLTFGLLSPNKGIEFALSALPDIIREFPNIVYIVLGQTHPYYCHCRYRPLLKQLLPNTGFFLVN